MIKLLEDNTVLCSDGANVNSSHPDKTGCAKSSAVATAFTYRHDILYERAADEHVEELTFTGTTISIACHHCDAVDNPDGRVKLTTRHSHEDFTLDPLEDQTPFSDRVKLFASIVFDAEVKAAFIASLPRVDEPVMAKRQRTVELPVMEMVKREVPAVTEKKAAIDDAGEPIIIEVEVTPPTTEMVEVQKTEIVDGACEASEVMDGAVLRKVPAGTRPEEQGVTETVGVTDEAGNPVTEEYDTGKVQTSIQYKDKLYAEGKL